MYTSLNLLPLPQTKKELLMQTINHQASPYSLAAHNSLHSNELTLNQITHSEQYLDCLELVDRLFVEWRNNFGDKLKDRKQLDNETLNIWAVALTAMGMTKSEFEIAFINSLKELWPPTAPADFLKLGRQVDEYIAPRSAFELATQQKYNDDLIYAAAKRVGLTAIREQHERYTYKAFCDAYEAVKNEHRQGASFEVVQVQLVTIASPPQVSQRFVTDDEIANLRKLLNKGI